MAEPNVLTSQGEPTVEGDMIFPSTVGLTQVLLRLKTSAVA